MTKTYQIATAGSHGDVLPFMALADELACRGHRVIVYGTPLFAKFTPPNVQFRPVGTDELYHQVLALLNSKNPISTMRQITLVMVQVIDLLIKEMTKDLADDSVIIGSVMNPAPHIFAEKYRLPLVNIHLSPLAVRSNLSLGRALPILDGLRKRQNPIINKLFWWWVDWLIFRPSFARPINRVRKAHGLTPIGVPMFEWINQSDVLLGFFDEHFAPYQADWDEKLTLVGFPFYQPKTALSPDIERFLQTGDTPVLFCAGTATANASEFFAVSLAVCQRLGIRAIFVSHIATQLPPDLPKTILAVDFVSYECILPKVSAFVHHGGVGNTAIALKTGTPQLIRPVAFDQFDNSDRVVKMGVGIEILPKQYLAQHVATQLNALLKNKKLRENCQLIAKKINQNAIKLACDKIEKLR